MLNHKSITAQSLPHTAVVPLLLSLPLDATTPATSRSSYSLSDVTIIGNQQWVPHTRTYIHTYAAEVQ